MAELTCSEFKGILLSLYVDLKIFNKLSDLMAVRGRIKVKPYNRKQHFAGNRYNLIIGEQV